MAKELGGIYEGWDDWRPCWICKLPHPYLKYHEFPWHVTCDNDAEGKKKAARWVQDRKYEKRAIDKAALPTLDIKD